jgi:hypothetical protein
VKKTLTLGVSLLIAFVAPAFAILGIGDIVFDPTSYGELVKQFTQMQKEYQQLVQTYQMVQNQYNQMLLMAKQVPVNMSLRYRAIATHWVNSTSADAYGTAAGWTRAINTGLGAGSGYSGATTPLGVYTSGLGTIPSDQAARIKAEYATVELTDGANVAGMDTIGHLRANAPAVEATIQNLENDSLSSDPMMNTEIAVLNKINAANIVNLRNAQDANKLLATIAEEHILDAKRRRDAEAQAFNEHIQFRAQGNAPLVSQAAGASAAMLAWRMP